MKKIISLGIASAVLAMTALSASAAIKVYTDDKVAEGATITVVFETDADIPAQGGVSFVVKATGATVTDYAVNNTMFADFNKDNGKFVAVSMAGEKAGAKLLTATFTVTAKEGEGISISIDELDGMADTNVTPIVTTVAAPSDNSGSDTTPSGSDTTPSGSDTTPSGSDTTPSGSDSKPSGDNDNPNSGIALAVFPAVVAGAAVVVAKKRK